MFFLKKKSHRSKLCVLCALTFIISNNYFVFYFLIYYYFLTILIILTKQIVPISLPDQQTNKYTQDFFYFFSFFPSFGDDYCNIFLSGILNTPHFYCHCQIASCLLFFLFLLFTMLKQLCLEKVSFFFCFKYGSQMDRGAKARAICSAYSKNTSTFC